ncbi:hypothetical protein KSP39_PZI000843 [Platanthera zijinensis]|uniref:Uncharacterized protein n=1 Tax=Platanthera zijinensis TaxID=2320716 RepID=A0AAP0C5D9_9ASPA
MCIHDSIPVATVFEDTPATRNPMSPVTQIPNTPGAMRMGVLPGWDNAAVTESS